MIRQKYSDEFEQLWNGFDSRFGEKGSKKLAYSVFKEKQIDLDDVVYILAQYERQRLVKNDALMNGEFFAPFQHVERYLRNERFDDDAGTVKTRATVSERSDAKAAAYLRTLGEDIFEDSPDVENVLEFRRGQY